MRSRLKKLQIVICFGHLVLGVLTIVLGVVSVNVEEASYNSGVYGLGVWLGIWMLISAVSGFLVASQPLNTCRINFFIGFCCVTMVTMLVCCIPLKVGPISYFSFESKITKHYYKVHGPSKNYYLSQSYFDERNRIGRIGCGVYGTLLALILMDTFVSGASCMVWKRSMILTQSNHSRRPARDSGGAVDATYNHNTPTFNSSQLSGAVAQDGFVIDIQSLYPKLPSYTDIYPEGSNAWQNRPNQTLNIPSDRPPDYTDEPTRNDPPSESPPAYTNT